MTQQQKDEALKAAGPNCGAVNAQQVRYDEEVVSMELLDSRQPFTVDLQKLIADFSGKVKADGSAYSELAQVHEIKRQLIYYVQRIWRVKRLDGKTAYRILCIYHNCVRDWCKEKKRPFDTWLQRESREWLFAEFTRVFKWEEKKEAA